MNFLDNRYKNRYLVITAMCDGKEKEYKYFFLETDRLNVTTKILEHEIGVKPNLELFNIERKGNLFDFMNDLFGSMAIITLDDILRIEIREGDEVDIIINREMIDTITNSYSTNDGFYFRIETKDASFIRNCILTREEEE